MALALDRLREAAGRHDRAARRHIAVQGLRPAPQTQDPAALAEFAGRWRRAADAALHRRAALAAADLALASARADVEAWAAENPFCPVCRGAVDVDHLLSAAHADGGAGDE